MQGVTITVRFPAGTTETKVTDIDGHADWDSIPVGTSYRVTETVPSGFRAVLPPAVTWLSTTTRQARSLSPTSASVSIFRSSLRRLRLHRQRRPLPDGDRNPNAHPGADPASDRHPGLSHPKGIDVKTEHPPSLCRQPRHRCGLSGRPDHRSDHGAALDTGGDEPFGVAVNQQTNRIYVANFRATACR